MTGLKKNADDGSLGVSPEERLFMRHFLILKIPKRTVGFKQSFPWLHRKYRQRMKTLSGVALHQLASVLGHNSLKRKLVKMEMKKRRKSQNEIPKEGKLNEKES